MEIWMKMRMFGFRPEKSVKYATNISSAYSEITLSQREVPRSPGWHMNDYGHTYLFNKCNLGPRLN